MMKVLVSSCLFGCKVRYHGGSSEINHAIYSKWLEENRVIHFCPEVAAGLPIPRASSEIVGGDGKSVYEGHAKVISKIGEDKTMQFVRGANLTLEFAKSHNVAIAVLKKNSPSCGNTSIYDGTHSGKIIAGSGVTAHLLMTHGIKVFNEAQLEEVETYINVNEPSFL